MRRALEEFTDLEHSKLFRTLFSLIGRPGFLTQEYLRGRKKAYVGPVRGYVKIVRSRHDPMSG